MVGFSPFLLSLTVRPRKRLLLQPGPDGGATADLTDSYTNETLTSLGINAEIFQLFVISE